MAGRVLRRFVKNWFEKNSDRLAEVDTLIPVPIHSLRLFFRGFNQTSFLLKSQRYFPVNTTRFKKIKSTTHQAGLGKDQRNVNLRESFSVKKELRGRQVLVFDDVCTTGQTLAEVSVTLKRADVAKINVLCLCRKE